MAIQKAIDAFMEDYRKVESGQVGLDRATLLYCIGILKLFQDKENEPDVLFHVLEYLNLRMRDVNEVVEESSGDKKKFFATKYETLKEVFDFVHAGMAGKPEYEPGHVSLTSKILDGKMKNPFIIEEKEDA